MGNGIPQALDKIYSNWQCFTFVYCIPWLSCCQWWCLLEYFLYYKGPKGAANLHLVMRFMSRIKVKGLIQPTDQQFSHWKKRTLDFNPKGRWQLADQCGVFSGLLSI